MVWFILFISLITSAISIPLFFKFAPRRKNYKGEAIPFPGGLLLSLPVIIGIVVGLKIGAFSWAQGNVTLFMVFISTFLGLADDLAGDSSVKGFKGHFKRYFEDGELTTGAMKAIFGGLASLASGIAIAEGAFMIGILNALIIAFMMNTINLLDLRPGRASKGFLMGFAGLFLLYPNSKILSIMAPVLGAMFLYLPLDLRAMVMMGDTGSNLLGSLLGLVGAWNLGIIGKITVILLLVGLMFVTERRSLTKIIEDNTALDFIDKIGRDD